MEARSPRAGQPLDFVESSRERVLSMLEKQREQLLSAVQKKIADTLQAEARKAPGDVREIAGAFAEALQEHAGCARSPRPHAPARHIPPSSRAGFLRAQTPSRSTSSGRRTAMCGRRRRSC